MKRDDLLVLLPGILLLAGMVPTLLFGGGTSRRGVGSMRDPSPVIPRWPVILSGGMQQA